MSCFLGLHASTRKGCKLHGEVDGCHAFDRLFKFDGLGRLPGAQHEHDSPPAAVSGLAAIVLAYADGCIVINIEHDAQSRGQFDRGRLLRRSACFVPKVRVIDFLRVTNPLPHLMICYNVTPSGGQDPLS